MTSYTNKYFEEKKKADTEGLMFDPDTILRRMRSTAQGEDPAKPKVLRAVSSRSHLLNLQSVLMQKLEKLDDDEPEFKPAPSPMTKKRRAIAEKTEAIVGKIIEENEEHTEEEEEEI